MTRPKHAPGTGASEPERPSPGHNDGVGPRVDPTTVKRGGRIDHEPIRHPHPGPPSTPQGGGKPADKSL